MFDIGWSELLLVALVTLIVVGPREMPRVLRAVRGVIMKVRGLSADFQTAMDDAARAADISDIKKDLLKDAPDASGDALFQKIVGEENVEDIKNIEKSIISPKELDEKDTKSKS